MKSVLHTLSHGDRGSNAWHSLDVHIFCLVLFCWFVGIGSFCRAWNDLCTLYAHGNGDKKTGLCRCLPSKTKANERARASERARVHRGLEIPVFLSTKWLRFVWISVFWVLLIDICSLDVNRTVLHLIDAIMNECRNVKQDIQADDFEKYWKSLKTCSGIVRVRYFQQSQAA